MTPAQVAHIMSLVDNYAVCELDGSGSSPDELRAAIEAALRDAPQAEPDERDTCEWSDDDYGNWESSCGELWSFIDGGPKENRVSFCHHCGKPAVVRASKGTI